MHNSSSRAVRLRAPPFLSSIHYYPNSKHRAGDDSDSISLYLRLAEYHYRPKQHVQQRVRVQYRFSLLDPSGGDAYELPAATGVFVPTAVHDHHYDEEEELVGCGYAKFITKEELERRRETLLKDDSLAIRCDVGVVEVEGLSLGSKFRHQRATALDLNYSDDEDPDDDQARPRRNRSRRQPDDREFIRRCLAEQRHHRA